MNLNEIKNLIEADGGKFIIIEDEKPVLVLMNFNEYKRILEKRGLNPIKQDVLEKKKIIEELNKGTETEVEEKNSKQDDVPKELQQGVTIEDLPF
ncbi:hypothetical protein KAS79_03695 [Candidatus Parcubacteria bacterium]|nr:hypothetical protein [Candidatus Parcubacteria bacterium]